MSLTINVVTEGDDIILKQRDGLQDVGVTSVVKPRGVNGNTAR